MEGSQHIVDWSRTREAMKKLMSLFNCCKCQNTVEDPCSFQMCDHYFCKTCALDLINRSINCPKCDAVLWREHLQTNLKIPEVMNICNQINELIFSKNQHLPAEQNIDDNPDTEVDGRNTYVFQYSEFTEDKCNMIADNGGISSDDIEMIEIDEGNSSDNNEKYNKNVTNIDEVVKTTEENKLQYSTNAIGDNAKKSDAMLFLDEEDNEDDNSDISDVSDPGDGRNKVSVSSYDKINEGNFEKQFNEDGDGRNTGIDDDNKEDEIHHPNNENCEEQRNQNYEVDIGGVSFSNSEDEDITEKLLIGQENVYDHSDCNTSELLLTDDDLENVTNGENDSHLRDGKDIEYADNAISNCHDDNHENKSLIAADYDNGGYADQINEKNHDHALTSVKYKENRMPAPCELDAANISEEFGENLEKSQFSNAISDDDCAQGIQRIPKSFLKKPKFTYGRKVKRGSTERKQNSTIPLLFTNRVSNASEEDISIFDFCSGTTTKTISFDKKADFSSEEKSEELMGAKRKRGDLATSTTQMKNVGHGGEKSQVNSNENTKKSIEVKQTRKIRNLHKRNKNGETSLHTACIKGNYELAKELLQLGAEPNTKDFNGWTPLHEACNHGFANIVELLLDHNAIIDCVAGDDNDTPLHDAVSNNRLEVARLLVERGAPIDIKNRVGLLPADYAITDEMRNISKKINTTLSEKQLDVSSLSLDAPYVFLTTNLKSFQLVEAEKCCGLLGGKLLCDFDLSVTHVICGTDENNLSTSRTMKYLLGVLTGKWMVSFNWISESLKNKQWEMEVKYEIKGSPGASEDIPKKARINHFKMLPKLFEGCYFYLSGNFDDFLSKETLTNLIKIGGGKMLYREPKTSNIDHLITPIYPDVRKFNVLPNIAPPLTIYHAKENSAQVCCKEYIIYDPKMNSTHKEVSSPVLCSAPVSWLLDCISNFQILDVKDHYEQNDSYKPSQN